MGNRRNTLVVFVTVAVVTAVAQPTRGQGLIWSLPEDGTWVRYEGTLTQEDVRPDSAQGNLTLEWIRHLVIKSVGTERAEFRGVMQLCRWLEIKAITGKPSESGIDAGPAGASIYKVLVPESAIIGKPVGDDSIPISMIPIVKGFRRSGEGPVEDITARALRVYPAITLLSHYEDATEGDSDDPQIPLGRVNAVYYSGEIEMERETSRSRNEAEFWISDEVPFGLAKWVVTVSREKKQRTDPRTDFALTTTLRVEMSMHEVGREAQSELSVP